MINKKYILTYLFLILLSIDYSKNQTLKIDNVSNFVCGYYSSTNFNLEAKEVPNELKLITFLIIFKDGDDKKYEAMCQLLDEEKLKTIAEGNTNDEDISFTCDIQSDGSKSSVDVEIEEVKKVKYEQGLRNAINFQKVSSSNIRLEFINCGLNIFSILNHKTTFRQVSHYELTQSSQGGDWIEFTFSVLTSQAYPKNYEIPIGCSVNSNQNMEKYLNAYRNESEREEDIASSQIRMLNRAKFNDYAICIFNKDIIPTDGQILPADLSCSLKTKESLESVDVFFVVLCKFINGFPVTIIDSGKMDIPLDISLAAPNEVDKLIKKGLINDVSGEEELPPIMNPAIIDSESCDKEGFFYIKGNFDKNIGQGGFFTTNILSGESITCYYHNVNKNIEDSMKCIFNNRFRGTIYIESKVIIADNKEILIVKTKINEDQEDVFVSCPKGDIKELILEELSSMIISFRQVCEFKIEDISILFKFIAIASKLLENEPNIENDRLRRRLDINSIKMKVNLMKGDELIESEAICTLVNVYPNEGEQFQIEYDCIIDNLDNASEYSGLEVVSSDDISGFPINSELRNPGIVDKLIIEGKVLNYTLEENINARILIFNSTSIDTTNTETTGIFYINGKLSFELIEESFQFDIRLSTGEIANCTFPKSNGELDIQIECKIQEELNNSKIVIEQSPVFKGYIEKFRINGIESEITKASSSTEENQNHLLPKLLSLFSLISIFYLIYLIW